MHGHSSLGRPPVLELLTALRVSGRRADSRRRFSRLDPQLGHRKAIGQGLGAAVRYVSSPPSTGSNAPVMYDDASLARKTGSTSSPRC